MVKQRSPRVGDIITGTRLGMDIETNGSIYIFNKEEYCIVTALIEKAGHTEVYYKGLFDDTTFGYEFLFNFDKHFTILEGATIESIRLLYGA